MKSADELIRLAEKIAQELPEVPRNDWFKWTKVAETYGLERALTLSAKQSVVL
jgi:hypothetical protein